MSGNAGPGVGGAAGTGGARGGTHRYAMIMAGGSGTRLWPMSRVSRPKQLIPFIGGRSLLEIAAARLDGIVAAERRLVCASNSYERDVLAAVPGLSAANFLGEPEGRDTLNAVGFAAAVLARRDPSAIFIVVTSDHVIEPQDEFARKVDLGFRLVEADASRIVTFSITPTFPATGYGYVEIGEAIPAFAGAHRTKRFVEKPDLARAKEFIAAGTFGWNSGMFIFHAQTALDAIRAFAPENHAGLAKIGEAWGTPAAASTVAAVYPTLKKVSVDHGLMEKVASDPRLAVCAVPMAISWKDVGSWPSYAGVTPADSSGNRLSARTTIVDSRDNVIVSDDPAHMVAAVGVEGLVIVHTRDATLVCRADDAERVKDLAARMPPELR